MSGGTTFPSPTHALPLAGPRQETGASQLNDFQGVELAPVGTGAVANPMTTDLGLGGHNIGTTDGGSGVAGSDVVISAGTGDAGSGAAAVLTLKGGGAGGAQGLVIIATLPTSDPHVVGALWANSSVVTVSAG